jgi:hypothetical protein
MPYKPDPPQQFLKNSAFQELFRRIEKNTDLLKMLKEGLPGPLARHCLYCLAREDGSLVIFSDSQAFASQLRFYASSILAKLNVSQETPFKQVLVRYLHPTMPNHAVKPMQKPSPEVIDMVKASSKAAPCDELGKALAKLGAAMERYAKEKT